MRRLFLVILLIATNSGGFAQELDAQKSAEQILRTLANQRFLAVWDTQTSEAYRRLITKQAFLSSASIGRPMLGNLIELTPIGKEHSTIDQATGVQGDFYTITFQTKYTNGDFYERVVVIKDSDGVYRLAGLFGSSVPTK